MVFFIPIFIWGVVLSHTELFHVFIYSKSELYITLLIGTVAGIVLHELSHAIAGLAYDANVFEMGIGSQFFIPIGYALVDDHHVSQKTKRIQICAAGIEMNLSLYGVFMILAAMDVFNPSVMRWSGIINLTLAALNLLPFDGVDGIQILSIICSKEDLLDYAKNLVKNGREKPRKPYSIGDVVSAVASYALIGFQLLLPVLAVYNVYTLFKIVFL